MIVVLSMRAWREILELVTADPPMAKRVLALIEACRRDPFRGLGKPEPLKNELTGFWSRRIGREHRLVYRMSGKGDEQRIEIAQCQHHYYRRAGPPTSVGLDRTP